MALSTHISGLGSFLAKKFAILPDLLVPPTCLTCDRFVDRQGGCCPNCWGQLRFIAPPLCPVMGAPFSVDIGPDALSTEAIANPPPFNRLRAVLLYDDLARKLVSLLKFSDRTDLAPWMAKWMQVAGKELLDDADLVIPVPLHSRRLFSRRFNQSSELARNISKTANAEFRPDLLLRRKQTKQQVGLSKTARERNLAGAFVVPDAQRINIKGQKVLLVDDVYTTGATVRAATRALKRGGASQVDVLVFAKVETHFL